MLLNISHVRLVRDLLALAQLNFALGVRKAGRRPDYDRGVELLADLIGVFNVIFCLLGVRGLQAGNRRRAAHHSGVLLVLGAVKAGIIRHDCDQSAITADVRERIQRVRRHIQSDHLHGAERSHTADGSADRHLCGNFLVGRPLRVNAGILYQFLADLRAGRAGIGR